MAKERKYVAITEDTGRARWQVPDRLWRGVSLLRRMRLRRALKDLVVPVLQELEGLFLRDHFGVPPRLVGKSLDRIEKDDVAIEAGLFLFELALAEELIVFGKAGREKKAGPLKSETAPVGGCAKSVRAVRRLYLQRATEIILNKAGRRDGKLREYLGNFKVRDVRDLQKLRNLARFDALSVRELNKGLEGSLGKLAEADERYLDILQKCNPVKFLRALRHALGSGFPRILEWDADFMHAVAEGLEHSAKITALGESLLTIENPDVVRAFGRWPMKEVPPKPGGQGGKKRKKFNTRIEQVKKLLGADFNMLFTCSPRIIDEVGGWKNKEIEQFKHYLRHLSNEVMEVMAPLPFNYRVQMLDGMWNKLGRDFIEVRLTETAGISVVQSLATKIGDMQERGSAPSDITGLVEGMIDRDEDMARLMEKV